MGDDLPGVRKGERVQITETDLGAAQHDKANAPAVDAKAFAESPTLGASDGQGMAGSSLPAAPVGKQPALGSYCGACGSPVHQHAIVCPRCGVASAGAAQVTGAAMAVALTAKSTAMVVLLSLVFTGAGHWYVGRIGRGFAFFGAALVCSLLVFVVVGLFLLPIVWVWAAIDANKCAQQHNKRLMEQMGVHAPSVTVGR